MGERIIRMEGKIDSMCKILVHAASDDGFNRCSERKIKIDKLEKGMGFLYKTFISGTISVLMIVIGVIIKASIG